MKRFLTVGCVAAVLAATCIASAVATLVMGLIANYPLALAPGMGINAYFTFTVVMQMKVPWQTALGAVFISGLVFFVLTAGLSGTRSNPHPPGLTIR